MEKKLTIISKYSMERLLRKAGAGRPSKTAEIALSKHLEEYGIEITKRAIGLAAHANRVTVKGIDIEEAILQMKL